MGLGIECGFNRPLPGFFALSYGIFGELLSCRTYSLVSWLRFNCNIIFTFFSEFAGMGGVYGVLCDDVGITVDFIFCFLSSEFDNLSLASLIRCFVSFFEMKYSTSPSCSGVSHASVTVNGPKDDKIKFIV